MDILEVNERSLSLFTILEPKPDIVFLGYGDRPVPTIKRAKLGYDLKDDKENTEKKQIADEKRKKDVANHIAKLTLMSSRKVL